MKEVFRDESVNELKSHVKKQQPYNWHDKQGSSDHFVSPLKSLLEIKNQTQNSRNESVDIMQKLKQVSRKSASIQNDEQISDF